jgi:hypothetical protein
MYVPGGAVAIDQSQLDTIRERQLLWELPPGVSPQGTTAPDDSETWIPNEYAWPVNGLGVVEATPAEKSRIGVIAGFAIVGVAVGIFAATLMKR